MGKFDLSRLVLSFLKWSLKEPFLWTNLATVLGHTLSRAQWNSSYVFDEASSPNWWALRVIPGSMRALGIIWLTGSLATVILSLEVVHCHTILVFEELHPIPALTVASQRLKGTPAQISGAPSLVVPSSLVCYPVSLPFFEAALSFSETARFWIPFPLCYLQTASKQNTRAIKVSPCLFPSSQGP